MQSFYARPPIPPSETELQIRSRLFLVGWPLVPPAFLMRAIGINDPSPNLTVIIPLFVCTAVGILLVKYALPKRFEARRLEDSVRAAAGCAGGSPSPGY